MASLRGRRRRRTPQEAPSPPPATPVDASTVQIMAHTLIGELFGTGLRLQNLASRVPDELEPELLEIADQIDKMISELRAFAFGQDT